jgi:DNA-binding SARP family transcriptional activator/Tfp pilus assembly protein PilF
VTAVLRILTLGGLTVESSERPTHVPQARLQGLGLLARLAVAGERGVSRDKLVGCFWPEKDERSALHSLSQALHRLRSDLGSDGIFVGTRILRLDPNEVSSDVGDIEEASRAGDSARIAELYTGPFLDGIFFHGAPEFERWIEEERQRLAARYTAALRKLATAASTAGDHVAAAHWWQKLLASEPLDSHVALQLVHSLAATNNISGALREARLHRTLVRAELQRESDPRIREFIERHDGHLGDALRDGRPTPHGEAAADLHSLTADQLCARGRQAFISFTQTGFTDGMRYVERAIKLEPQNAQAHMTLGWLYILLSQAIREGSTREQAVIHCQRAAELNPNLVDVPLALGWIADLEERFEEAECLARRAIALEPAYPFAHYVLGWIHLNHGLRTGRWEKCVESVQAFDTALRLNSRDQHSMMSLATMYSTAGQYEAAEKLLDQAVDLELAPAGEIRMIAALTLRGLLHLHRGEKQKAREDLVRASREYASAAQIFAPYVLAMTHCGLGDLERFVASYDEAVAHYARGRALLDRLPALIGAGYLAVRLETRLAGAFRRLYMRPEEERHVQNATRLTANRDGFCFNWCWGVSEAELHYDWAVYHANSANLHATLASLRKAFDYGWRDISRIDVEPAFAFCRRDASMAALAEEVRRAPPLPVMWSLPAPAH